MARLKALGLRPEGSNGAVGVFDNLNLNNSRVLSGPCDPLGW
jgi:hypothetical protein